MDSVSTKKAKPRKMKKSRVQLLLDLFYRVIEITVVMVTVTKLCYQLVITFEGSCLASFLMNRHVAFFLGNAIVVAIVAQCGFFVNQEPDAPRNNNDFYDEFVRESSRTERSLQSREKQSIEENRAKQSSEDKTQSISENRAKQDKREKHKKIENSEKERSGEEKGSTDITARRQRQNIAQNQVSSRKSCERSLSENLKDTKKSSCGKLKRSKTERYTDGFESDDELRYKIESFIARQRRNQKDEEFCII